MRHSKSGSDHYCYPSRTGVEPSWFWHADLSDPCSFPLGHIAYMPCEKSFWTRKNLLCQNCSHPPANAFLIDFGVILRSYIEILRAKARRKMRKCIVVGQFGSTPVRLIAHDEPHRFGCDIQGVSNFEGGGCITKDYPACGDICVDEKWAGWTREAVLNNSGIWFLLYKVISLLHPNIGRRPISAMQKSVAFFY